MSSECARSLLVVLCFILAAGAQGGTVCTVRSGTGKEVLLGSNLNVSCIFNKECKKEFFWNSKLIHYKQRESSREVFVYAENLTKSSIFTCKCKEDPEPCGIDITPGYPPSDPQNLTCIRYTKLGNVSCSWTTGRDTKILTTCQIRVEGDPYLGYVTAMNSTGFCNSTFPIKSSVMSKLIVTLNVSNSLGSKTSGPHTFILSNIVKPSLPEINNVNCSSRCCHLHTDDHNMNLVEVQYKSVNEERKKIIQSPQTNDKWDLSISSLHPHTTYEFKIRRKINHKVGLWSDWSQPNKVKTEEEAPDKAVDVWYLQEPKDKNICFRIFWKELNPSDAKGMILGYNITVVPKQKESLPLKNASSRNSKICCFNCSVSVSAVNMKGQSPANFIKLYSGLPSHHLQGNHSVAWDNKTIALFWPRLATEGSRTQYVVHWYPVGNREKFQWIRVKATTANITGLQPLQCYQGAVTALKSTGPVMKFFLISTWQSVPEQGPVPQTNSKSSQSLKVKWSEIPLAKRRGCLKNYTVYWKDKLNGNTQSYSDYPKREYTITGLSPGQCYILWVTAWTDAGEGPNGSELPFCTPSDTEKLISLVILAGGAVLLGCLFLLCICQFSAVHKRCQCLLPRVIPDPANSKCAKSYVNDQDEIKFYLQQCDSSMSEEPDNVEVEEVPYHHSFTCTYIKSFSQESGSSDATQITRTTDIMEDYISTHGAISGGEEGEDEEEDAGFDEFEFFPSTHSHFFEPLVSAGGKLTLDVVKIDCSEFLDFT